jgi:hypothetical protein
VGETTPEHTPEPIFAIETDSGLDLDRNLAVYRRLTASQREAHAAELKRKVELEIANESRQSRRRPKRLVKNARLVSRLKSNLAMFIYSMFR